VDRVDAVVGGAGIIGLSVALELARSGLNVMVYERGRAMGESSWAAAGMLAAEDPENPRELDELAALSRTLYPEYLRMIECLSERQIALRTRNTLQLSEPGGAFRCSETKTRYRITHEEAERRIAGLKAGTRALLWLEESSLDPRDLCAALPVAARAAGVMLEENTAILAVDASGRSVRITTTAGELSTAAFVNCCGAWASQIHYSSSPSDSLHAASSGENRPVDGRVEPRKGQMTTVRMEGLPQLQHVLRSPTVYLVPRGDTRIAIGASVERAGFDREVESATVHKLLAGAAELWPPIASARVVESWAGLRPGTSDQLPLIGRTGEPNCWWATGHFRNGILLAPATALVIRQLLQQEAPAVTLDSFAPDRSPPVASSVTMPQSLRYNFK
jgi:glycine oxidase